MAVGIRGLVFEGVDRQLGVARERHERPPAIGV
jgi:hypothetical protein